MTGDVTPALTPNPFPTWDSGPGDVLIGNSSDGAVTIRDGGTASNAAVFMGFDAGVAGTVVVTGTGSSWTTAATHIGWHGRGDLTIEDGATVTNSQVFIGVQPGAVGTVTVNGANWNVAVSVLVGDGGQGELKIENGATVSSFSGFIGARNDGTATATISGPGTTWETRNYFFVGDDGTGTLTIEDGAKVTSDVGAIGVQGTGTVTVRGQDADWSLADKLYVGRFGDGTLTIASGGRVSASTIEIGNEVGGSGRINLLGDTVTGRGVLETGQIIAGAGTSAFAINGGVLRATRNESDYLRGFGVLEFGSSGVWFDTNGFDIGVGTNLTSAAGGLTKTGEGSLTLSGVNTFGGETRVLAGTLVVNHATGGVIDALPNHNVFVQAGATLRSTVTGSLNSFNFLAYGEGTVGLSAANGTTLTLASSHFGMGGSATVRFGSTTDAGTIIVAPSSASASSANHILVEAGIVQAGNIRLVGLTTTVESTTVAQGATLDFNDFTYAGSLIRNLQGDGTVRIGADADSVLTIRNGTFAGVITGAGGLEVDTTSWLDAGTLVLTGTNTYSGPTIVTTGTLVVGVDGAGSIANSDVTVKSAGVLMGSGHVGGVTVEAGGIHAPGNSIGTQTAEGPYVLQAGSVLEIETNAAGQSDRVVVTGTVDVTGATLRILAEAGNYALATNYIIIDNDGTDAVTGTFTTVTNDLAFLDPSLTYAGGSGNDVVLTLTRNDVDFLDVAATPNQRAVAAGLNDLARTNPLVGAVFGQSTDGARRAFDALSGEVHATAGTMLARDARFTRDAIMSRLQHAQHSGSKGAFGQTTMLGNASTAGIERPLGASMMSLGAGEGERGAIDNAPRLSSPLVFWTQALGSWGDANGDGNAASYKRNIGGFFSGTDVYIGSDWRMGAALGYAHSNLSVAQRISSAEIDSYHLAAYVGGPLGAFNLRTGASWSWHDIDTKRTAAFPGFLERVDARYDGGTGQIFGEIALPMSAGAFAAEPFAGLAYVHISRDRFSEQGDVAALSSHGADDDVGFSTLGVRFAWESRLRGTRIVPRASVAWQHAFGDVEATQVLSFAGAPSMTIAGTPLARNTARIEAGLDISLSPSATLGIVYNGEIASDIEDHGLSGRFSFRF
jgi:outer membrane autotransporter protein